MIRTKKLGAGDYVTTNTSPVYYISKSYDGSNTWILHDELYDMCGSGHYSIWDTKRDCLEVIKEKVKQMSKERQTFPWDTVLSFSKDRPGMFVHGTNIQVEWDSILKVYWEVK